MTGFWPAIFSRSPAALSRIFLSATASPTPMLSVIFATRGTCIFVLYPNCFMSAGTIACSYWTLRRGGCVGAASLAGRSDFLAAFSPLPPFASLPSFAGWACAGACFGAAGFAAPFWSFPSLSDFASFVAILTSDVHDLAVGLEETDLARRGLALRLEELE